MTGHRLLFCPLEVAAIAQRWLHKIALLLIVLMGLKIVDHVFFTQKFSQAAYEFLTKPDAPQIFTQSPSCSQVPDRGLLPIRGNRFGEVIQGMISAIILPSEWCFQLAEYPVYTTIENGQGLAQLFATKTRMQILDFEGYRRDRIPVSVKAQLGIDPLQSVSTVYGNKPQSPREVVLVAHLKLSQIGARRFSQRLPDRLSVAQTIDWGRVPELLAAGAKLIDVRDNVTYIRHHHHSSINIPYLIGRPEHLGQARVRTIDEFGPVDHFDFVASGIPMDQQLIVAGADLFDLRAVRALFTLWTSGINKLYWLRNGERGRLDPQHSNLETPAKISISEMNLFKTLQIVNAQEVEHFLRDGIALYDVREHWRDAPIYGTIEGAHYFPVPKGLTQGYLAGLNFTANQDSPIIIMGQDEFDFSAMRFAQWLSQQGWQKVLWFRAGFLGWCAEGEIAPLLFPIKRHR